MKKPIRQYEPACDCGCFYVRGNVCANEKCKKERIIMNVYYEKRREIVRWGKGFKGKGWDKTQHKVKHGGNK